MAEIRLEKISKIYDGNVKAVDKANFKIHDKEFVVLVGPSGCGKSTTLRMIAGLEDISEGELYIDDELMNNVSPKDRNIAMVFQNYALYPHMSVFENMAFGLKLRKFPKVEIKKRVQEAAEILGIVDLLDRKPKALSGGQRQRVAVGRAIVRKPKVFLFDEPLSNLDAKLRVLMRTEISKLHKKLGVTMIYVTHDQTEAMTMGDRIVIMKDGFVQQIDTPLNLYNKPVNKFVAGFIGSPAMNFIEGSLVNNNGVLFESNEKSFNTKFTSSYFTELANHVGNKAILGIRPEDIKIASKENHIYCCMPEVIEPLGNETYVYFTIEGQQMVARFPSDKEVSLNENLYLDIDREKIHLFDSETEKSIN